MKRHIKNQRVLPLCTMKRIFGLEFFMEILQ